MKKLSSAEVKRQNKKRILKYMIQRDTATKPEIAAALQLSLPTVGVIVGELLEAGLLCEIGMQASNGGRPAIALQLVENARLSLGIDITKNHVYFVVVNLRGEIIAGERQEYEFANLLTYYHGLVQRKRDFLKKYGIENDNLVGQSCSMPGIVSKNQRWLEYSHIFELKTPMRLNISKDIQYPYMFVNDGTACCMAECYSENMPDSFVYVMLSNTVGGSMVIDKKIVEGKNIRGGEIGHICLVPGGKKCYCGRRGHFDAYCSARVLAEQAGGRVETFFARLEEGDSRLAEVFDEYLDMLALMVYNLHIFTDLDIVIGGYVGSYLAPYLPQLKEKIIRHNIFDESKEFVFLSRYREEAAAVGGALHFIEQFIEKL